MDVVAHDIRIWQIIIDMPRHHTITGCEFNKPEPVVNSARHAEVVKNDSCQFLRRIRPVRKVVVDRSAAIGRPVDEEFEKKIVLMNECMNAEPGPGSGARGRRPS